MDNDKLFILSEQTFARVVQQITPAQLDMAIPDWFDLGSAQDRAGMTLKNVLNYHAYDTAWVPETFAGRTIAEVGDKYDGDLLGNDPLKSYQAYSDAAIETIHTGFDPERLVHFTYGDYPAKEAITHPASFRVFRAYDFAKLIGSDRALPAELVEAAHKTFEPRLDEWRQYGIFGAARPVGDDADPQAKLFAMVGRDPDWA